MIGRTHSFEQGPLVPLSSQDSLRCFPQPVLSSSVHAETEEGEFLVLIAGVRLFCLMSWRLLLSRYKYCRYFLSVGTGTSHKSDLLSLIRDTLRLPDVVDVFLTACLPQVRNSPPAKATETMLESTSKTVPKAQNCSATPSASGTGQSSLNRIRRFNSKTRSLRKARLWLPTRIVLPRPDPDADPGLPPRSS